MKNACPFLFSYYGKTITDVGHFWDHAERHKVRVVILWDQRRDEKSCKVGTGNRNSAWAIVSCVTVKARPGTCTSS